MFASSKGGVGKTTSALVLSSVLTHHGAPTTLIDADPNAPLVTWSTRFPDGVPQSLTVKTAFRTDVADVIDSALDPYVIVDLEGSKNEEVSVAIGRADLVLIPMKGNQLDADEAVNVIKVIRKQETIFRRTIPFRVFLSQTSPVIMDKGMRDICSQMRDNAIPMLRTAIVERSAYKAPFRLGGTIYELTEREVNNPAAAIDNAELLLKRSATSCFAPIPPARFTPVPEIRPSVKLDFTSGLEVLPPRPKMDAATTEASVAAGRQLGFSGRTSEPIVDGRRLKSRGANTQLNLKVTADDKAMILMEASRLIQDPSSPIGSLGQFVIMAVDFYLSHQSRHPPK